MVIERVVTHYFAHLLDRPSIFRRVTTRFNNGTVKGFPLNQVSSSRGFSCLLYLFHSYLMQMETSIQSNSYNHHSCLLQNVIGTNIKQNYEQYILEPTRKLHFRNLRSTDSTLQSLQKLYEAVAADLQ